MTIDLIFITYNRLEYTKLALASVLADPTEEFSLTIWDNASTDGTVEYLKREVNDSRIVDVVFSKENVGQTAAVNQVWSRSKADLLGKLDNDCLVTAGWTRKLAGAHNDIDHLGVIACWHYPLDDFDEDAVTKAGKIQRFGHHQVFRHPWTGGTGILIKRDTFIKFGCITGQGTTPYWVKIASSGYINGYYYPLIPHEHMDDPKSKYCMVTDDDAIREFRDVTVVLRENSIGSMEARWKRRKAILKNLNSGHWEVKYYTGWRGKTRRVLQRVRNCLDV